MPALDSLKVKRFDPMRFLWTFLFLLTLILTGKGGNEISDNPVSGEVLSAFWIQIPGSSGLAEIPDEYLKTIGALYLPRPMESPDALLIATRNLPPLAIQLDTRLNPFPGYLRDLPDLGVLGSIRDEKLLRKYFKFLEEASKGFGFDYLILPEVDPTWRDAEGLFSKLIAFDSAFFMKKSQLMFETVEKKKAIQARLNLNQYWVATISELNEMAPILAKVAGKKFELSAQLSSLSKMKRMKEDTFQIRDHLPNQIAFEITREAIVPLQVQLGTLPLSVDTLSLITNNPAGPMATMLAKYTYLLTTEEGIRNSRSPILIDGSVDSILVPLDNRLVIFTGSLNQGIQWSKIADAALLVPFDREWNDYIIPQLLFGAGGASGKLPDHISDFNRMKNDALISYGRLGYIPPQLLGIDETTINKINAIVEEAIQSKSTPGCQLGLTLNGAIVLEAGYGYLTYDSLIKVDENTLYDIASISKVAGTLLAVMKLTEDSLINLDAPIATYLMEYSQSDKANITVRQILSHQAGLRTYIPYWKRTLKSEFGFVFSSKEKGFMQLIDRPDVDQSLLDSLHSWILNTPLYKLPDSLQTYRYSDIGFMILQQMVERLTNMTLENYLWSHFYSKMGLQRIGYNPLRHHFERFEIAPTEYDGLLRDELVWGEVHDQNAKIFGGIAGHAGLFSNAHELLVIQQMLLQGGWYNGYQFLHPSTINTFNGRYFENNRRGLGWDKPGLKTSNASNLVSDSSYGHTGFTGSMIWSDPTYDLSFVFLSNRIYPDATNWLLVQKDIRARIQTVIYEAVLRNWVN